MNKQVKKIGQQSATEHRYENGAEVLVSYATSVAAYVPGLGWMETTTKYSRTTSRHISDWRKRNDYPHVVQVPQEEIDEWVKKLDGLKILPKGMGEVL
jgi:hypothetical protein